MIQPLTEKTCQDMLMMITDAAPKDKKAAQAHGRKVAQIISTFGNMTDLTDPGQVEEVLLILCEQKGKKGILNRLRKGQDQGSDLVLGAAIDSLGKIGTPNALLFLEKMAGDASAMAAKAKEAADRIKLRFAD